MKRATRFKAEVVNREGEVLWEVLVRDMPEAKLANVLRSYGYTVRQVSPDHRPPVSSSLPMIYSELDPEASIVAAREYWSRHDSHIANALMLLLERAPDWVSRDQIRKVAGDQGDRRVRELRQRGWPVEMRQLHPGAAWHVRLLLPGSEPVIPEPIDRLF